MPRSFPLMLGLSVEHFEQCCDIAKKFTAGEIRYSSSKAANYVPPQYKCNSIKVLSSDAFWLAFCRCYRQNSNFAMECLLKLSLAYCIADCTKDFNSRAIDFQQQLQNSGVVFTGDLDAAVVTFDLPLSTTAEQAHFLLTSRYIQKQLTRTPNFSVDKAKANINEFMKTVAAIQFDHVEEISDLKNYDFIACFGEFDWEICDLPENCLVFDFYYQNDPQLGHQTDVAWNVQIITKGLGKPENGNIPLRTLQARIYKLYESDQQNANTARSLLQDIADEKGIEIGNVMDITELSNLFEFASDKSSCLIIEPPLQWYETIISAVINNIQECPKLTLVTQNANGVPRFKETFTKIVAQQWQKKAEKFQKTSDDKANQ
uniref:Uncharacterized protein n=1 Tax=Panagrolaimus sp. PS1159 TaxID=55785 RepID=A0AC35FCX0_9BILA